MEEKRGREAEGEALRGWAELVLPWLAPPDLAAVASASKALRSVAMGVSYRRASDASRGLERHPVPFLNPVDAQPYSYFLYARFPLLALHSPSAQPWGGRGPTPSNPSSLAALTFSPAAGGCACAPACASECPCSLGPEPGMELMTECGVNCPCGPECRNRVTQGGISARLRVVKHPLKGWGLHAAQFVKRGQFICEYAGEFLITEEARNRQRTYDELASSGRFSPALLVVREHLPSGKACLRVNIDATKVGNVARFINHSCDGGNLSIVLVRSSGSLLPRLCFFAAVDIQEGEELTFSYGSARLRQNGQHCFCGSSICSGMLPSEET
ncbi:histone-lysine N-methyltransferase SUVR3 [Elaeis guineensis]|uniref:histone-lysine N-methyltransferase SUVR3 n=1 Tax=Elaeis guineensis var. tenera TaxID=51953 RepID=UPI003C6D34C9